MVKIFSIKNEYCTKIFDNEKLVELRRQDVKIKENERCLIYTTSPVKRITGYFVVKEKIRLPIKQLWMKTKDVAGVTKSQFMGYFKGCTKGTAIFFKYVKKFVRGLGLDEIKSSIKNFRAPQSYCNLSHTYYNLISKRLGEKTISLKGFQ